MFESGLTLDDISKKEYIEGIVDKINYKPLPHI